MSFGLRHAVMRSRQCRGHIVCASIGAAVPRRGDAVRCVSIDANWMIDSMNWTRSNPTCYIPSVFVYILPLYIVYIYFRRSR